MRRSGKGTWKAFVIWVRKTALIKDADIFHDFIALFRFCFPEVDVFVKNLSLGRGF